MKVLKFGADWCTPCKTMEPIVKSVIDECGVELESFNIDDEVGYNEAQSYEIRNIPAFVLVDDKNKVLKKLIGSVSKTQLKEFLTT